MEGLSAQGPAVPLPPLPLPPPPCLDIKLHVEERAS